MTIHQPRPLPAARPKPLPAAAAAHAGAAGAGASGAAAGGQGGDRGRRGLIAAVVAGMLLGSGIGGSLYMSAGVPAAGSAPTSPASPPAPVPAAAASASPDNLAAGISTALQDYQCAVTPAAGGRVLVPADFGKFSCVIISATAQSQVGGGFVAPCTTAEEAQQFLDAQHSQTMEAPSCLPTITPNKEAELSTLGCKRLSYFFSGGRKYLLCN